MSAICGILTLDIVYIVLVKFVMAPRGKRQKGDTSATEPSSKYDKERFVSYAAQKKYVESSVKKGVIQERGFYVTMDSVAKQVENRK